MADNTKIEWTDATWNPVNGCSLASPGCTNCYAMKQAHRVPQRRGLTRHTSGGMVWTGEVRFDEAKLTQPLHWKRPRRIFVCAHGDLFHDAVPDEWIDRVFAVMALCPQHTFQVLTKRSARMLEYARRAQPCGEHWLAGHDGTAGVIWPLPNVWLGVSVEDQTRADERIPDLLATPAAVRWISAEPLLGPVDLTVYRDDQLIEALTGDRQDGVIMRADFSLVGINSKFSNGPKIDWVVVGGESGPGARPMHPDWARTLRDQCAAAGVPFFFKQWGEFMPVVAVSNDSGGVDFVPPMPLTNIMRWRRWDGEQSRTARKGESVGEFFEPGTLAVPLGKRAAGRLLDGTEHNATPKGPAQ